MIAKNLLILYKQILFLLFIAGILKNPGIKLSPKGYIIDNPKLIKVSFNKMICVFLYTAQKHDMKYQRNNINKKLNTKNIINLAFKQDLIFFDFFLASL